MFVYDTIMFAYVTFFLFWCNLIVFVVVLFEKHDNHEITM